MSEVKVLIEGYAKKLADGWLASPSTVLIKDNGLNILVDPGCNRELLLQKLVEENLKPQDINLIFLTHHHLDHSLNIRLFLDASVLLDGDQSTGTDKLLAYDQEIPGTGIKVIKTPGHIASHQSLLVETADGKIAVAGDVFWWQDDEEQKTDRDSLINHPDGNGNANETALKQSRQTLLDLADYIIPGHGKMFKVEK